MCFEQMAAANASYAWVHAYRDEDVFVTGLWEETAAFLDLGDADAVYDDEPTAPGVARIEEHERYKDDCPELPAVTWSAVEDRQKVIFF